uniref:Chaperonin GroEL n=1 Tax=Rhodochaete parvula TaxID=110510 RepID=A0A1X9PV38_9RHOD|nr:60 kDa chaperone protein [Rhodochaete parvula]ASK39570.1 chaperonin GroEL [Rhodochaete parvula]|eukprot:Plantae.Rhodophyta-Rhodochaete_pulchella.ctg4903.p2 GENE.Plantae.Rhodophyta-Rhodochaete_pulchella.ctg4903~~Plantae.Rhodophyta-Rhodochaete_pulchella.ctg4903.p2  ORF type:complete len:526 (+),score=56.75 Plantae.Rhodophyta-Rhodochaete_pulchella.ctg4903:2341-3918(+)
MKKGILYEDEARQALETGIEILTKAVAVTIGPKGRNVVISKTKAIPQIINDGVSIAKEIELKDPKQNAGVSLIKQAASKTNEIAGDGTTTATILAYSMIKEGVKSLSAGNNPISIKKGIQKATLFVISRITEIARPIQNLEAIINIASISAGNDKHTGSIIASAIKKVGRDGIISIEEGRLTTTELEITEGMKLNRGFMSPYFVNDVKKMEIVMENPLVLITDKKITLVQQELIPILEKTAKTGKPILIIADDIEKEALATIIVNKLKGKINIAAIRAPEFGNKRKTLLQDIAILTNGEVITEDLGLNLNNTDLSLLGVARKIIINKDSTTIIADDNKVKINARCEQIRRQIEISDNLYNKENLQERLAKLIGGVAVIKVGAATEIEMKERKLRLEDALNATKAAIEEGIVAGGGSTLVHISQDLQLWSKENLNAEELIGATIVEQALIQPFTTIVNNAGQNGIAIVQKVKNKHEYIGYNASKYKFINMYEEGIIDPAKVTRSAIQNAASVANMFLTTECLVINN